MPGVYEVRGYSRWPRTESTGAAADEFVRDVLGVVDAREVTLVARFAAEGLRENYIGSLVLRTRRRMCVRR